MINPIIFAGLLLMATTPAFAAPTCWFNGYQMQCGYPQTYRPEERREQERERERREHEQRERHEHWQGDRR